MQIYKYIPWYCKIEILRDAAKGLIYLHKNDYLHRDLKPENILICAAEASTPQQIYDASLKRRNDQNLWGEEWLYQGPDFIAKLGDLGEARSTKETEKFDTFVGTQYFKAPEILSTTKYTYKVDIFSLGVVIFWLIEGKMPWDNFMDNLEGKFSPQDPKSVAY